MLREVPCGLLRRGAHVLADVLVRQRRLPCAAATVAVA